MTFPARFLAVAAASVLLAGTAHSQDLSASHRQAADEFLTVMGVEAVMEQSTESMLRIQIEQTPDLAQFQDILRSFLHKYVSWDALHDDIATLYAESFTEAELREMSAFYRTETGRKAVRLMPELTARGMELGQRAVLEHQPELEARIRARAEKLNGR